ncbi:oxidoreductase [Xanthomonas arboricola]|uniref:oxidoreductase n=1 Tax=Xanthomonas arboricola TaxID=56448 RepID=UPI0016223554|nr:oxidoreductase [Xanthomonas arboricola]MBB4596480.1 NAD(P)-dependent dehydrogenase (short-subunit alcohol dehydrogenase family) [Xanthomonas arboricola]
MSNDTHHTPVWFVTGCSTGLGRALAQRIVEQGWRLVATARDKKRIADLATGAEDRVLLVELDVTRNNQITAAVVAAQAQFGRIDVLVNNAGYGYQSSVEEGIEAEIRAQFDANVFGVFAVTRSVLPIMRNQRSGSILNISSVAGLIGYPGSGYYAASKHAVEGFSDALRTEVRPFGIKVSCIEPGPFRTDWAGRSLRHTAGRIADYESIIGERFEATNALHGNQPGDPTRAANAMIELSQMETPPRHLPLGEWGYDAVLAKHRSRLAQLEQVRAMSISADFPDR